MKSRRIKVVVDAETGKVLEILPRDNAETFGRWLREKLARHSRLHAVVGDMCASQRRTIERESRGSVRYVVDVYHVVRAATDCVQRLRIRLMKSAGLSQRTGEMGGLRAALNTRRAKLTARDRQLMTVVRDRWALLWRAYFLKEELLEIYWMRTLPAAEQALRRRRSKLTDGDRVVFGAFLRTLDQWENEILNYWRVELPRARPGDPVRRVTNGAIEARNNQLAVCYATSRGWERGPKASRPQGDWSRGFRRFRVQTLLRYGARLPLGGKGLSRSPDSDG